LIQGTKITKLTARNFCCDTAGGSIFVDCCSGAGKSEDAHGDWEYDKLRFDFDGVDVSEKCVGDFVVGMRKMIVLLMRKASEGQQISSYIDMRRHPCTSILQVFHHFAISDALNPN